MSFPDSLPQLSRACVIAACCVQLGACRAASRADESEPAPAAAPQVPRDPPTGPLEPLFWTDFTYEGAVRCPDGKDWAYLDYTALSYVPERGTLLAVNRSGLVELALPEPKRAERELPGELPVAREVRPTTQIHAPLEQMFPFKGRRVGGMLHHEGRVWISVFQFYNVAGRDRDGLMTLSDRFDDARGPWRVGPTKVNAPVKDTFHANKTHGYLCHVPPTWSAKYAPGKTVAAGRHRGAGAFGGAQGPALFVFSPDDAAPAGSDFGGVPVLIHPTKRGTWPEYRNKDSFLVTWVWSDKGQAVLVTCVKGLGEDYYGPGPEACYPAKGWHAPPYEPRIYFLDPRQLGEAANGGLPLWEPQPYQIVVPDFPWRTPAKGERPECRHPWFSALAYDSLGRRLFVLQARAFEEGESNGAVIHVLRVSDG